VLQKVLLLMLAPYYNGGGKTNGTSIVHYTKRKPTENEFLDDKPSISAWDSLYLLSLNPQCLEVWISLWAEAWLACINSYVILQSYLIWPLYLQAKYCLVISFNKWFHMRCKLSHIYGPWTQVISPYWKMMISFPTPRFFFIS
jgi:hypothetical protein